MGSSQLWVPSSSVNSLPAIGTPSINPGPSVFLLGGLYATHPVRAVKLHPAGLSHAPPLGKPPGLSLPSPRAGVSALLCAPRHAGGESQETAEVRRVTGVAGTRHKEGEGALAAAVPRGAGTKGLLAARPSRFHACWD